MARPAAFTNQPLPRRKKEQRTDIWSNLLRQTREAQARNRSHAIQHREIILCGGSPEDQRSFVESISRVPPPQPRARNTERKQRPKGEVRLSNRYAYGYGHVTLFSPPQQSGTGVQVLGAEAEEVAHVEVHTLPAPEEQYITTLRRLLNGKKADRVKGGEADGVLDEVDAVPSEQPPPAICILLTWKEPWKFLHLLQKWVQLLAQALLPPDTPATDPVDVLKEAKLGISIVVQHTETQEALLREGYREEDFDYISQCLRTAILPLHPLSALVYTSSTAPPQQPGSSLSEAQKVVYTSLGLDLAALSPKLPRTSENATKPEFAPKHEFMDRMAIVIPAAWDSVAFIRTLSETFAPEEMLSTWLADLQPIVKSPPPNAEDQLENKQEGTLPGTMDEVFESSPVDDATADEFSDALTSASRQPPSAIHTYETKVQDPQAHKIPKVPQIEVTTKPDQTFLAEMRAHLQQLQAQDSDREATRTASGVSNTSLSSGRAAVGLPAGGQTGALEDLGDVSFNVGGVSYDIVSTEAAIERLKRPQQASGGFTDPMSPVNGGTPRNLTPRPLKAGREGGERSASSATAAASTPTMGLSGSKDGGSSSSRVSSDSRELPIGMDKLEEYFQSLMKKSGAGASREGTPTRPRGE